MENITINIESPVKYYDFKDQHGNILATLRFVPSDLDIVDRHEKTAKFFEKMEKEIKKTAESKTQFSHEELVALKNEYASKVKQQFDYLFNSDTSGFFTVASPFTPLSNGTPWAAQILESVGKIIFDEMEKNTNAMKNAASKYTDAYKAAPGKYPFL